MHREDVIFVHSDVGVLFFDRFGKGSGRRGEGEVENRGMERMKGRAKKRRGEEATITRENYRAVSPFGKLVTLSSGAVYAR